MKSGPGMWVLILGILALIVGGAVRVATSHHIIGYSGIGLGIILIIIGAVWWMTQGKKAPTTAAPQPAQPAKTPLTS